MKLREVPRSLGRTWRLRTTPVERLLAPESTTIPVVVSLTSIPSRLLTVALTIRSVFAQSVRPKKIVLWLNQDLKKKIPKSLAALDGDLLEIRFSSQTSSHRKLVHSLGLYPDEIIVTCDDDVMYAPTWLARLYESHQRFPNAVIAHECRTIRTDANGELVHYRQWPSTKEPGVTHPRLLAIGFGGVLYPPKSLDPRVVDSNLYLELAPSADDLWFKAMSLLKGVSVRRADRPCERPYHVLGTQWVSLNRSNISGGRNRQQWMALERRFGEEWAGTERAQTAGI